MNASMFFFFSWSFRRFGKVSPKNRSDFFSAAIGTDVKFELLHHTLGGGGGVAVIDPPDVTQEPRYFLVVCLTSSVASSRSFFFKGAEDDVIRHLTGRGSDLVCRYSELHEIQTIYRKNKS